MADKSEWADEQARLAEEQKKAGVSLKSTHELFEEARRKDKLRKAPAPPTIKG